MREELLRTASLIGENGIDKLSHSAAAVFGLGGVGSYAAEALVRSGLGTVYIYDNDTVAKSNINRQLIALDSTVGLPKAQVMAARAKDINPSCRITALNCFYDESNKDIIDFAKFDYVIDAIDTISSKLLIIELASRAGTRIISCMGAGNKLNAVGFEVADIYKTSVCPLARVMRREKTAARASCLVLRSWRVWTRRKPSACLLSTTAPCWLRQRLGTMPISATLCSMGGQACVF